MAEVLLFHHAQGLTPGVLAFGDKLRNAGNTVHVPDLYEGRTFETLDEGVNHARGIGFDVVLERGKAVAAELPSDLVYAGFSLGVMPAQLLAQARPGCRGALLFSGCLPVSEFSQAWPTGVPVQIHSTEADPEFVDSGDIDAARALVAEAEDAELFLYPGNSHLFVDSSLPSFEAESASVLTDYVVRFLDRLR
ncbi:dienelactone hydrolase family protein [Mycetocola zhadangensis]|uniref:Dienelactone hydrolase n=1 Tax=Mycetocola zhadangensis TaxID=1164595 RepID=A0A3L7J0S5_9MICO|nr:dienelactone hydrolase family protein [Mycetocola zhadangensis]RLQ83895.1 dienelactone hydrolase [Mycetocola zhadangensis]GGE97942.1 dienelactone hydrolase [Mycetocola zhadangensis]